MKTNDDHEEDDLVTVFVAYEDFAAGSRAMAMLKRVDSQSDQPGQLVPIMWRFDVLADASFFELAVGEALAADIIVIATKEGKGLPQRIKDWIARWLLMKERRPLALVATLDYPPARKRGQESVLPYLARLAQYGKMRFFANGNSPTSGNELAKIRG